MLLKNFIDFNPKEILSKDIHRKISMDQLKPFRRHIISENYEMFTGGSKFKNGDTIMARITPCLENGKTAYVNCLNNNEVAFGSTEFIVARAKEGVSLPLFVYYLLCSSPIRNTAILSMTGSSGRERVQQFMLDNYEIPYYSLSFQQHIVDTIGTIDNLIEKTQIKVDKLMLYAQSFFNKYESKNIEIFKNVFTCFNGGTFKSKDYVDYSPYKLITIKNIDDNGFNTDKTSFLNIDKIDNKYLLKLGDILLTMTGNIGRVGVVDDNNCYLNQRVLKLASKSKLYLFLYLTKYKTNIINLGKGTAQQNLSLQDIYGLKVYNSKEEIEQFTQFDYIFDLLLQYKLEIRKLRQEKDLLLKKYFG